jgi:hypothetical protein
MMSYAFCIIDMQQLHVRGKNRYWGRNFIMSPQIRSFASFSIFFVSTSVIFWPVVLLIIACLGILPAILYWDTDVWHHLAMLGTGNHLPQEDWSLIFVIPAFVIGLPALFCHYEGELLASHWELYSRLTHSITTPYGMLGWLLTVGLMAALLYWAVWCVRATMGLNYATTSNYLAVLALILGAVVFWV